MVRTARARKWKDAESSQTRRRMATLLGESLDDVNNLRPLPAHDLPLPLSKPRVQRVSEAPPAAHVTLVVYGWHNVEPGTLSWVFPNVRTAIGAANTMKNAVQWAIVKGDRAVDVDSARRDGSIVVERCG